MAYTFTEPNLTSGIDEAIISTGQNVTAFPIMILVFTYFLVILGGSTNQKRRIGTADYPFWAVLAGMTITFEALLMTMGNGMIDLTTLGIVIAVTIMSGVWFFLSKIRGEQ